MVAAVQALVGEYVDANRHESQTRGRPAVAEYAGDVVDEHYAGDAAVVVEIETYMMQRCYGSEGSGRKEESS